MKKIEKLNKIIVVSIVFLFIILLTRNVLATNIQPQTESATTGTGFTEYTVFSQSTEQGTSSEGIFTIIRCIQYIVEIVVPIISLIILFVINRKFILYKCKGKGILILAIILLLSGVITGVISNEKMSSVEYKIANGLKDLGKELGYSDTTLNSSLAGSKVTFYIGIILAVASIIMFIYYLIKGKRNKDIIEKQDFSIENKKHKVINIILISIFFVFLIVLPIVLNL